MEVAAFYNSIIMFKNNLNIQDLFTVSSHVLSILLKTFKGMRFSLEILTFKLLKLAETEGANIYKTKL